MGLLWLWRRVSEAHAFLYINYVWLWFLGLGITLLVAEAAMHALQARTVLDWTASVVFVLACMSVWCVLCHWLIVRLHGHGRAD